VDRSIEMAHLSWTTFRDRVEGGAIVILPVGALEQHGHHLPLGVDAILATEVSRRVAHRVGGVVAPAIPFGYKSQPRTGGGDGFPGTTGLDAATLIALLHDVLVALGRRGARKLAIVDGHYENELFLSEAVDLAMRDLGREDVRGVRIVKLRYFEEVDDATIELLWPDGYPGMALEHAALMETSMMLHVAPGLVHLDAAPDEPAAAFPPYDVYPPDPSWVPPAGALSSPMRATAAFGEHLMDRFVDLVATALEREFG
jgi:creatinine amidohydrolase